MYQVESSGYVLKSRKLRFRRPQVRRNVVLLGLTSLFTDISSEMVSTILPLYLIFTLGLSPLQFGIIDGIYLGAAALVRIVGGLAADRRQRYKEVAAIGYALSAISKIGLLVVGGVWTVLAGIVLVDRTGKGIRTAPRDALISLSSHRDDLATAFGVHRALDTAGAMIGPLLAFILLSIAPDAFDAVFVVSFCTALIGLAILVLFVENQVEPEGQQAASDVTGAAHPVSLKGALSLLGEPRFRLLVIAGTGLALVTMSDSFLYLGLQRRLDLGVGFFPLLFVGTALVFMVLAVPVGRLADRVGRTRVFIAGYLFLLIAYSSLLLPSVGRLEVFAYLMLLGAYYAATDGVLMALASAVLPSDLRASGLALIATFTNVARLCASVVFGMLWTWQGVEVAVSAFAVGLFTAIVMTVIILQATQRGESW